MIKILTSVLDEMGVIKNVLEANRLEEINGANTLDFQSVLDAKLQTLIEGDSIFEIDGAYFDTAFFKKTSNEDGTYMVDVEAEHVSYRLNKPAYNVDFFSEIGTPTYILGKILEGTDFTVGTVEFVAQTTYSAQEAKSRRQVLMEFVATLKGELSFHNFEISILTHRGSTDVKPALKGKNIKIVTKTLDKRNLDAEGNPTISYTCEPLYLPEANYALGDEVMLMQKEIGVMEALRVVRISANPYDDAQVSYDFANYTNGLEDSIYRIMTQAVAKDALYNGVRIGPEYGFEAVRNDKRARAYFRSDGFVMQSGDGSGEGWRDRLYFDPLAGVYMFDGMLSADMITALEAQFDVTISNTMITNVLSAESATIAELTVDSIDTSDFVQRYIDGDTSPVGYWRGYDQTIDFFEAIIIPPAYQPWTDKPASPVLTVDYPYQMIWASGGSTMLGVAKSRLWFRQGSGWPSYQIAQESFVEYKVYDLYDNSWRYQWGGVNTTIEGGPSYIGFIECNSPVYTDSSYSSIKHQPVVSDNDTIPVKNRAGENLYWKDDTKKIVTTDITAFPVLQYAYNGPNYKGVVKLKIHHDIDPETGYATPEMVWGEGEGVGDNQKGFIYKDNDGLKMEYVDTDGKLSGIQIGSFVDANMRRLKSCAINKTAGTVTVVGEGQTGAEAIVIGMVVGTNSVTYTWPDGHIATVTIT